MDELLTQLEELGVDYTEDTEAGTVVVDIASIDKTMLIDVIIMLNNGGYTFDMSDTSITISVGTYDYAEDEESYDEDAYIDDALAQM